MAMTFDELEKLEKDYISCLKSDRQKTYEINVLARENGRLLAENERLKIAHARYECVRRLSPRSFAELYEANIRGDDTFDDLVDRRMEEGSIR